MRSQRWGDYYNNDSSATGICALAIRPQCMQQSIVAEAGSERLKPSRFFKKIILRPIGGIKCECLNNAHNRIEGGFFFFLLC